MVGIHWPTLHSQGYASKRQQTVSSTGLPASLEMYRVHMPES
jgi:hypothetical protein